MLLFKDIMLGYAWNINDINNESLGGRTPIFYNAVIQNVKFPSAYHCIEKLTLMIDVSGPDYRRTGYINYGDDITYEAHYWLHNLPKNGFVNSDKSFEHLVEWVEQYVFTKKSLQHIIPCLIDIIDVINTSTHSNLTKKDLLTIITEPQNLDNDWV
jgi:hypothetical protein